LQSQISRHQRIEITNLRLSHFTGLQPTNKPTHKNWNADGDDLTGDIISSPTLSVTFYLHKELICHFLFRAQPTLAPTLSPTLNVSAQSRNHV
jgi:hypothetical protein